ncbi:MAG: germination protein YpeB, partial [Clostridia bacterium]|nr:germination protein YpeB [Clostridia bacterium]
VCYTDLLKVGVAMDDGQIVLYEASGYLTNHRNRTFKTPDYSEEDALKVLSEKLNVNSISMTLIPTDFATEVRCYEFACTSKDGQEILVFINAETLKEENVLILLKSDGGTLVK